MKNQTPGYFVHKDEVTDDTKRGELVLLKWRRIFDGKIDSFFVEP